MHPPPLATLLPALSHPLPFKRELADAGCSVTLIEQGRGLGGRVCSRRASVGGTPFTFDHGAQYLTVKSPAFAQLMSQLEAAGVVARWGADGSVGDVGAFATSDDELRERGSGGGGGSGALDVGSFQPYDAGSKLMYVGVPTMSAVGRHLAAAAGERVELLTATRVAALQQSGGGNGGGGGGGGGWQLELEGRGRGDAGNGQAAAARWVWGAGRG